MRTALGAAAALVLASALPALADDMPGMNMDSMPTEPSRAQAQTAEANGTVKAVDVAKGTITISHGAVPTLKWPPMTMAFSLPARSNSNVLKRARTSPSRSR